MASESGGMKSTFLAKVSSDLPNRLFLPIARKIGKLHQEFVRSSFLFTPKVLEALRSGVIVTRWRRVGMKWTAKLPLLRVLFRVNRSTGFFYEPEE
jgi:hypothetical protein